MQLRKFVSLMVAATVCIGTLGGCADNTKTGNSADGKSVAESGSTDKEESEDNPYGYDDPITLKVGYSYDVEWSDDESPEDNRWTRMYEENGYHLETLYSVDDTQGSQKLTTAIASGTYPDVFRVSNTDLQKYARNGVITDITEAYEKYATPELKQFLEQSDGKYMDSAMVDGKLYGIPRLSDPWSSTMMLFIRQDWLDNLGLEAPSTMEDLKKIAYAFTYDDPDGNGKDDTYGLALNGKEDFSVWSGMQAFFEGYGVAPGHWSGTFTFVEKDGKIQWGGADAETMKKALKDLNEMYEAGSLAKGFASANSDAIIKDISAGTCGMYFAPCWGAMGPLKNAMKNNINAQLVAYPIPDGNGEGSAKPYINDAPSQFCVISSKCDNPEALVKLANLSIQKCQYPTEEEGDSFRHPSDGSVGPKADFIQLEALDTEYQKCDVIRKVIYDGEDVEMTENEANGVKFLQAYYSAKEDGTLEEKLNADDPDVLAGIANLTVYAEGGSQDVQRYYRDNNKAQFQAYTTAPTENMANKYATLNPMVLETIVKIVSGSESVDFYDTFLESWEKLGGEEVTKEAQEWYDSIK